MRAEAWIRFAAAILANGESVGAATEQADMMLEKFDERFEGDGVAK